MNKFLRFSFLSVLLVLFGINSYADDVTFDFSGDNAYEQFGLAGFSASGSSDGDFTENKSVTVGGVTITVSPSTTNTPNRMWSGSMRLYGGTLTVSAKQTITALNFTLNNNKWGNNTCNTGSFTSNGVWSGSASEVVITIGGNTQIKSLTVTVGGGEVGPVDPDPKPDDPVTDEVKAVSVADFLAAAESTTVWYQLKGSVKNLKDGDKYGNFDLEDATGSVYVYGLLSEKGGPKQQFQQLVADKGIKEGSVITIIGNRGSFGDKDEVLNAYFVSIEGGETPGPDDPVDPQPTGKRQYKKATSIESGKGYLLVAESEGKVATPIAKNYGYLLVDDVTIENGVIEQDDATNEFVFTATDGGYTILQSDGRYLYQTGNYNSFNVAEKAPEGDVWTAVANGDGTYTITNVLKNKWMQYSTRYGSYGSYNKEQDNAVLPTLYVLDEGGSEPVAVEKTATFDATKDMTAEGQGEFSLTKDGITMSITNGMFGDGKAYRYYKNATLTFSAPGGTITKIEFTDVKSNPVSGFGAPSTGKMEGKVWTGSASEVSFVVENKQVRASLVEVTYLEGAPQSGSAGSTQLSKYPYAKPELIAQAKELLEQGNEEQLAEVMKEVARSHSHGEGLSEAEDITDQLAGEWTVEEFTDGEGIEGEGYYKAQGKDIVARVYMTVPLKAGRYMLTATGRGQKYNTIAETIEERLQVMAINNDRLERYQSIARNDREGGVYGEGWDDASDFFTMTADGEAVLGARFVPIAGRDSWAEVGNFRLVRLGDVTRYIAEDQEFYNDRAEQLDVLLHRTLKQDDWNSLVLPMDLDAATIEEQFGKGTQVATLAQAKGNTVEFTTLKEAAIEANVPVLVKPTAVKSSHRYIFHNVAISKTVATVVKGDNFNFVGYYNPNENPVEGGLGFDVVEKSGAYAAVTTSAAIVPTADQSVAEVLIDGETYWVAAEPDPEAKMAIIGAAVPATPTAIDTIQTAAEAGAIYNVAGQRVSKLQKGINIVCGKKIVVK